MKIKFEECEVDQEVISVVAKFTAKLSEIESRFSKGGYDTDGIMVLVRDAIVLKIAGEYLKEHKMKLVEAVDIKKITDAVQLKIVEGFSLNKNNSGF